MLRFAPEERITPAEALRHPFFELELAAEENVLPNAAYPHSPRAQYSRSATGNQRSSKQGTAPQGIPIAPTVAS